MTYMEVETRWRNLRMESARIRDCGEMAMLKNKNVEQWWEEKDKSKNVI